MNRFLKSAAFPILVVILLAYFAQQLILSKGDSTQSVGWSGFVQKLDQKGAVAKIKIDPTKNSITYQLNDQSGTKLTTGYPGDIQLSEAVNAAEKNDVLVEVTTKGGSPWWSLLTYLLPFVLFLGLWVFLMNQMQGGGSKVMSFGKSRAKRMAVDSPKISFRDVAGADEAVEELHEIKEFLENPKKFQALGARIPKGVLLYGPPGTGKTLLARAVAGEAGVPFFSISGSDFVEMFVGVGASRVRDLFEQAKQNSPCIIFMDEIDAVGRHRGAGLGGGHDEREQTLNQLLVEMDGFELKDNIIMIAATNRPDILDPALLRPGRFDRQIVVDRPDREGRKKILEVHTRGKPIGKEIELSALAGQTPGFTGADLANLVNEAALLAARHGRKVIGMTELEEGIMRVIAGPEKKTRLLSEKERLITAYHEMGHAIVGHFLEGCDPVHKISVISRGQALGYTISMPSEDTYLTTRSQLRDQLAMTLGGRAAEELVFDEITTGAANDLEKVTATAKNMIMRYGMSEKLGPRTLGRTHDQPFLGREFSQESDYSDEIAREIDDEIRRIVEEAHERARAVLTERDEALHRISKILVERETIDRGQFLRLLDGEAEESVFPDPEAPAPPTTERTRAREAGAARACCRFPEPSASLPSRTRARPSTGAGRASTLAPCPASRASRQAFPRPAVVGVVNVTPDSFSDGGDALDPRIAIARGLEQLTAGAAIVDIGGESTRPGSRAVAPEEELAPRAASSSRSSSRLGATISIDTRNASVAQAAVAAGASLVNDVSALRHDPHMAGVVADAGVGPLPDAHARRRSADDAGRSALRRRRRRRRALPRGSPRGRRRRRRARGAHLPRPGHRLRQDASSTTCSCCAGCRASRGSAGPLLVGVSRKSFLMRLTRPGLPKDRARGIAGGDGRGLPRRGEPAARARRRRDGRRALDRARARASSMRAAR